MGVYIRPFYFIIIYQNCILCTIVFSSDYLLICFFFFFTVFKNWSIQQEGIVFFDAFFTLNIYTSFELHLPDTFNSQVIAHIIFFILSTLLRKKNLLKLLYKQAVLNCTIFWQTNSRFIATFYKYPKLNSNKPIS